MNSKEIREKIIELLDNNYYDEKHECLLRNNPETDEYIADAIKTLFESLGVQQYSIDSETTFDSPSYEVGVVSVCWVDCDGKLDMEIIIWEIV